jgi:hypothetical protein
MDFDHPPGSPKILNIAALMSASLAKVREEMARCDLVCSNCHRLRTWTRKRPVSTKRRVLLNALKSAPCLDCNTSYPPCVMDFDHRPGEEKVARVSQLVGAPLHILLAEIAKCDLICSNCHRERTQRRLLEPVP